MNPIYCALSLAMLVLLIDSTSALQCHLKYLGEASGESKSKRGDFGLTKCDSFDKTCMWEKGVAMAPQGPLGELDVAYCVQDECDYHGIPDGECKEYQEPKPLYTITGKRCCSSDYKVLAKMMEAPKSPASSAAARHIVFLILSIFLA